MEIWDLYYGQVTGCMPWSAKSKNLDGAWEFLRYYLTQEYQDKIQEQEYNLPVLRSTFEKECAGCYEEAVLYG